MGSDYSSLMEKLDGNLTTTPGELLAWRGNPCK